MENVKQATMAVGEKIAEVGSHASYETNKSIASNSNASVGTRVGAAIDAVGDKFDETVHAARKEEHKQRAIH